MKPSLTSHSKGITFEGWYSTQPIRWPSLSCHLKKHSLSSLIKVWRSKIIVHSVSLIRDSWESFRVQHPLIFPKLSGNCPLNHPLIFSLSGFIPLIFEVQDLHYLCIITSTFEIADIGLFVCHKLKLISAKTFCVHLFMTTLSLRLKWFRVPIPYFCKNLQGCPL